MSIEFKLINIWTQYGPKVKKMLFWRVFFSSLYIQSAQKPLPNNTLGTFDYTCLKMSMSLNAYRF